LRPFGNFELLCSKLTLIEIDFFTVNYYVKHPS